METKQIYEAIIKELEEEVQFVKDGNSGPEFVAGMNRAIQVIKDAANDLVGDPEKNIIDLISDEVKDFLNKHWVDKTRATDKEGMIHIDDVMDGLPDDVENLIARKFKK